MKKYEKKRYGLAFRLAFFAVFLLCGMALPAQAKEAVIKQGILADGINLSGMTAEEASQAVAAYVENLKPVEIVFLAGGGNEVATTAGELGITWANPELVQEALQIGLKGNIIERYKVLKDLEHENKVYDIRLGFDVMAINRILTEKCAVYDQRAVHFSMERKDGVFRILEGQTGYKLDIETSIDTVYNYLANQWDQTSCKIPLDIAVEEPKGSAEALSQVTDVIGSCSTSYSTSGASRSANVKNGCELINGTVLYPGEEFSTYQAVAPFTTANGYYMAGSYLNGRVVDSLGGGICQVSTTLYNAVLNAELDVTERHNHSMIVNYVDPSADAAIAESAGKDFRFVNNTDYPIYIEGTVSNKNITFRIYGKEVRDPGRVVTYKSEVLETILPQTEAIYPDAGQPVGYINKESAHIGYKARLWKVVTQDGAEISRTQVNSSSYKMTPRTAYVGVATTDPNAYNEMMAAIGTGSIDHVQNVINLLTAQAQPPADQAAPAPEEGAPAV
ncbi:MAG: VanW family protein [Clostridium sp.]|jgi:vancomycin resistance protein YoaR|nr:VanW family protein [Clostridium sp.]